MAGRRREKRYRVKMAPVQRAGDPTALAADNSTSNDALLRFVRALARAAAIEDYNRTLSKTDAISDSESGDLRKI